MRVRQLVNKCFVVRLSLSPFQSSWSFQPLQATRINPLINTLIPHSKGPSYSNTVTCTLAADGRAVTFGTAMRGPGGPPVPSSLDQM